MTMNPADNNFSDNNLYDTDFYAWTVQQQELLAQGRLQEVDIAHLVEELASMGKSEQRSLSSRLEELTLHLLKWCYQPKRRSRSWELSIIKQRDGIADLLEESPSLRSKLPELLEKAYSRARRYAAKETNLPLKTFPEQPAFTLDQILDNEFWP